MGFEIINKEEVFRCDYCEQIKKYGLQYLLSKEESDALYFPKKELILCENCLEDALSEFTRHHAEEANKLLICSSCSGYIEEYEHYYTSDKQDIVLDIYFEGKICVGCWDTYIDNFYRYHIY